jgi:hypothetical protein
LIKSSAHIWKIYRKNAVTVEKRLLAIMKKYWPLLLIVVVLVGIVGMSQYADSAKHRYEESARQAKAAAVAKGGDGKADNYAEDAYKPPVWAKYVTFPEGIGAWAIILTLLAIAWQSIETRAAAITTAQNTAAFILSQRPIIACDPHQGINAINDMTTNGRMRLELVNRGQTKAFHCLQEVWIEFVPRIANTDFSVMDDFEFTENAIRFTPLHQFSLYPNHTPLVINVPAGRDLSEADKIAIRQARLLICVRLLVRYRDNFLPRDAPDRFSAFGFWVMLEGLGNLSKYQDSN